MKNDKTKEIIKELKRVIKHANRLIAAVDTESAVLPKTGENYVQERILGIVQKVCVKNFEIPRGRLIQRVCEKRGIIKWTAITGIDALVLSGAIIEKETARGMYAYSIPKK